MTPRLVGSRQKQRNRVRFVIQMPRWHLQEGDAQAGSPEGTAGRTSTRTRGLMISGTLGLFVLAFIVAIFISWNFLTQNSDENPEEKFIVTDAPKDRDPCINGEFIKCWHYKHAGSKHQGAASWPTQSCIENNHCGGTRQSPIDIETTKAVQDQSLPKLTFKNFDAPMTEWELMNNGHSAAFKPGKDDKTERTVSGGLLQGTYVFTQFHFHWGSKNTQGSEHLVDSKASVMEMHMVFMNKKYDTADKAVHNTDGIAVLATFFQVGTNSRGLDTLAAHLSEITTPGNIYKGLPAEKVSLLDLLPTNTNDFYTYEGSLTTPPCWEAVTWTVFRERSEIKQSQLDGYRKLNDMEDIHISNNYRPPQAINGRVVKTTFAP